MKTLIEFLTKYNTEKGYTLTDASLHESLIGEFDIVSANGGRDSHRWYEVYDVIVRVSIDNESRYFKTFRYETKGKGNADDYGLDRPTAEGASEVYPHTVSTTVYKKEPQGWKI